MADSDIPAEAVEAAAQVRWRQYDSEYDASHLTWRDFAEDVGEILAAALPHIRAQFERDLYTSHERGWKEGAEVTCARVDAALRDHVKFLAWHRQANRPLHSVTHAEVAAYYLRDVLGDS